MKNQQTLPAAQDSERDLDDLYRGIIMEHYRSSAHRHGVPGADLIAEGKNPLCGDEVRIEIRMQDGKVAEAGFLGEGCAISVAAASLFMEMLPGKTRQQVETLIGAFTGFIKGDEETVDEESLEDLAALEGVSRFPVRIKCALLPFMAVKEALNRSP